MKSFKKVVSLVLALVLCFALAIPTMAAKDYSYSDVEAGQWYTNAVERWNTAELIKGYAGTDEFGTTDPITRGQVAVIMARLFGLEDAGDVAFSDVTDEDAYYYDAVLACANAGIINGVGFTENEAGLLEFQPNANISREAAFKIVMDALLTDAEVAAYTDDVIAATLKDFADGKKVNTWADEYVAAIIDSGAVKGRLAADGKSTEIAPGEEITRAEFATILDRLVALYVDINGNVSVYVPAEGEKDEAVAEGAGYIVINAANDNIIVETKKTEAGKTEVTISKVTVDATTGTKTETVVATKEITNTDATVEIVHGQTGSINETKVEVGSDEVIDATHYIVKEDNTNCAVDKAVGEYCDVCGFVGELDPIEAKEHDFYGGVCNDCGMTVEEALKFDVKVESNENYVEAIVTNDYAARLVVTPGKVDPAKVTLSATMQNVGSLGVDETRSHSVTVETGLSGDPALNVWLKNAFEFKSGTVKATIEDYEVTYNLTGEVVNDNAVITAIPADVNGTRAAWQELTSHVATKTQGADDSYITIANGSYMNVAGDTLRFEDGVEGNLKLDNFSDFGALEKKIRETVVLIENDTTVVLGDNEAIFYLAEGTELAVGSSVATLTDNCTITVSGDGLKTADFENVLTSLRDAKSTYDMAEDVVLMINAMIGSANTKTLEVNIDFN